MDGISFLSFSNKLEKKINVMLVPMAMTVLTPASAQEMFLSVVIGVGVYMLTLCKGQIALMYRIMECGGKKSLRSFGFVTLV